MEEKKNSEFLKTLQALILYEKEVYLLYADAAKKILHPECSNILNVASEQTKNHMKSVARIYLTLIESHGILDKETLDTLSFMKDILSNTKIESTEILKACIGIETRMGEIYKELAEEKQLEAEFNKMLAENAQKDTIEKLAKIIMRISIEEGFHRQMFEDMLTKYHAAKKEE